MAEQKTCEQCQKDFVIEEGDLKFYKNISPTFADEQFIIPSPRLCPECRNIRRMLWRNERSLYKRKCDKTGKELISIYSPDKKNLVVWDKTEWFKDDWDPIEYGREYEDEVSFFKQVNKLLEETPRPNISLFNTESCDYCNFVWNAKNCYLCFAMMDSDDCLFSTRTFKSKKCTDCTDLRNCEFCYECLDSERCYNCQQSERCKDCTEVYFSYDCRNCSDLFLCTGLRGKRFCIRNIQLTKEEYLKQFAESKLSSRENRSNYKRELSKLKGVAVQPATYNSKCENCTGDYLIECNNCKDSFLVKQAENSKFLYSININIKNSYDLYQAGDMEWGYEGVGCTGYKNLFNNWTMYGHDNIYSVYIENCSDCFGCFGLKQKQYCILNKQYTKEEYEKTVAKIAKQMIKDNEWGEFFPAATAPFCYNETVAMTFNPKTKDEIMNTGACWQDNDYSMKYEGPTYIPQDDISEYKENVSRKTLLEAVVKCEITNKPYKIMPQELAFYIEHNIPIPTKHYDERYKERIGLRNPRVLYKRECMCEKSDHGHNGKCQNEFETTYAPDQPEVVYCESCYQKEIL